MCNGNCVCGNDEFGGLMPPENEGIETVVGEDGGVFVKITKVTIDGEFSHWAGELDYLKNGKSARIAGTSAENFSDIWLSFKETIDSILTNRWLEEDEDEDEVI